MGVRRGNDNDSSDLIPQALSSCLLSSVSLTSSGNLNLKRDQVTHSITRLISCVRRWTKLLSLVLGQHVHVFLVLPGPRRMKFIHFRLEFGDPCRLFTSVSFQLSSHYHY